MQPVGGTMPRALVHCVYEDLAAGLNPPYKQEHVPFFREKSNTGILSKERNVVRQEMKQYVFFIRTSKHFLSLLGIVLFGYISMVGRRSSILIKISEIRQPYGI